MNAHGLAAILIAIILSATLFAGLATVPSAGQSNAGPLATVGGDSHYAQAQSNTSLVTASASKKYVVFRDDDIAPFSDLNTLKAVNQVHINENVPVSLAIIPHPDITYNASVNELLMDKPLLNYLLSIENTTLFDFTQHGYNHHINGVDSSLVSGGLYPRSSVSAGESTVYSHPSPEQLVGQGSGTGEFPGRPYADQYNAIKQGYDDFSAALGVRPTTFVPPWDVGDANTLKAAQAVGFTLYNSGPGDESGVSVPGITVQAATQEIPWQNTTDWNTSMPSLISQTDTALNAAPAGSSTRSALPLLVFRHV